MAIKPIFASMLQALLASTPFRSACPGKHGSLKPLEIRLLASMLASRLPAHFRSLYRYWRSFSPYKKKKSFTKVGRGASMLEAMLASTASTALFEGKRFEIAACKHPFSQADRQAMLEMASMLDCHHYFPLLPSLLGLLRY